VNTIILPASDRPCLSDPRPFCILVGFEHRLPTDWMKKTVWVDSIFDSIGASVIAPACVVRMTEVGESGREHWKLTDRYNNAVEKSIVCSGSVMFVMIRILELMAVKRMIEATTTAIAEMIGKCDDTATSKAKGRTQVYPRESPST